MPILYLSPSTQEGNAYVTGSGSEEYWMNLLADAMEPYLLSCAIQYHHIPYSAPKEYRNTVELVYLADLLVNYSPEKYDFEKLYLPILNKYNIKSEEDLRYLAHTIQKKYQNMLKTEVS